MRYLPDVLDVDEELNTVTLVATSHPRWSG
jgi:hypothetical protein